MKKLINLFGKRGLIAIIFLALISIFTGYFLLQIDRHEKALLGQVWLNPVPTDKWKEYVTKKENYEKKIVFYKNNNPQIIELVREYNGRYKTSIYEMLNDNTSLEVYSKQGQSTFSIEHPEEFKIWRAIMLDLILEKPINVPTPSNPAKTIIQQSINNYYRYMIAGDCILLLSLIVFLVLFKDKSLKNVSN